MKDIRYFLDEENKYCQTKPEEILAWDEEVQEWDYKRIPLAFLRQRPFQRGYDNIAYRKQLTNGFNLSDSELTMLGLFIMHHSRYFRDDYYGNEIPILAKNMFEVLDCLVAKAPITENQIVYRFCVDEDESDMEIGDTIIIPHNLTCTADKWNRNDNNIYIIHTLPKEDTNAHDLYRMYLHGHEKQVNFLRGTRFLVVDKKEIDETEYHIFVMNEIK